MIGRSLDFILKQDKIFLLTQAHSRLDRRLDQRGFRVEVIPGDVEFESVEGTSRKDYLCYSSPDWFDRTPDNFLTIRLVDAQGRIRALQGARFEALGQLSLEEFQMLQLNRLHKNAETKGKPSAYQLNPARKEITGNTVYHGDLIASPNPALPRGVLETFCVSAMLLCFLKWDQDYSWCFLRERHQRNAIAMRYGFFHQYPYVILWDEMPAIHLASDWIGFNSREDIEYLAKATLLNDLLDGNMPEGTPFPLGSVPAR